MEETDWQSPTTTEFKLLCLFELFVCPCSGGVLRISLVEVHSNYDNQTGMIILMVQTLHVWNFPIYTSAGWLTRGQCRQILGPSDSLEGQNCTDDEHRSCCTLLGSSDLARWEPRPHRDSLPGARAVPPVAVLCSAVQRLPQHSAVFFAEERQSPRKSWRAFGVC